MVDIDVTEFQENADGNDSWLHSRTWIHTFMGHKFEPFEDDPGVISIRDIAHALSNECRYSGHCRMFYSVAEHSVRMANILWDRTRSFRLARAALLHDAAEAYLSDVPRPLKKRPEMAFYCEAERRLQVKIFAKFGMIVGDIPPEVKALDTEILGTEARSLFISVLLDRTARDLAPVIPGQYNLGWSPGVAEVRFLDAFRALYDLGQE